METGRKCLLLSLLCISSRDLWNYFCTEPELSVIIVTKQLPHSNRLLVSLHYICLVCPLGHAVWNMPTQKCKWLTNVMAVVIFIGNFHPLMGYGRQHTQIGYECPREVEYLCFPQGQMLFQAYHMADGTSSNMLKWCLLLEVLSALHKCFNLHLCTQWSHLSKVYASFLPSKWKETGRGSSLKGGHVHRSLRSGLNSTFSLKINVIYWIRQKK